MQALVAAPKSASKIEFRNVPEPQPNPFEALVEVKAFSANRGELRRLASAPDGWRPGWDVAGVVLKTAADGSGPKEGSRVVGLMREGAWAERVALPVSYLSTLPTGVSFSAASTLPVAGLTALAALRRGGLLLGSRVLITGAAGGVGRFAVQLARRSEAHITAVVGRPERTKGLKELGADEVVVESPPRDAKFDLILESVGGSSLARSLNSLKPGGTVVLFGNSSGESTAFDSGSFYPQGGAQLYGLLVFVELQRTGSAPRDLNYLTSLLETEALDPQVDLEMSWRDVGQVIDAMSSRTIAGKAVLKVE